MLVANTSTPIRRSPQGLMSSSLLLYSSAHVSHSFLFVRFEAGGRTFAVLCDAASRICSRFFSMRFISVHVVYLYNGMGTATARKKSRYVSLDKLDFHIIDSRSLTFHVFARCMLRSFSVDDILLQRYANWSANFWGLSGDGSFLLKTYILFYFNSHRGPCLLVLDLGDAVWTLLGVIYLWEVLGHLRSVLQS